MTDEQLNKIYENNAYPSAGNLYKIARKENIKITLKQAQEFIKNHRVAQIHKKAPKQELKMLQVAPNKHVDYQLDLLDMSSFGRSNGNNKWILICVDVFTKKASAVPIKSKNASDVLTGIQEIMKHMDIPRIMSTDDGGEFKSVVEDWMTEHNIWHRKANSENDHNRLGIVNAFSKWIKNVIYKGFTHSDSDKWIDKVAQYIKVYNNRVHSNLGNQTPNEAEKYPSDTFNIQDKRLRDNEAKQKGKKPREQLKVGDIVRLVIIDKKTKKFQRGFEAKFSKETHKIERIVEPYYYLENGDKYRSYLLQRVSKEEKGKADPVKIAKADKKLEQLFRREMINIHAVKTKPRPREPSKKAISNAQYD
jgi:hypothetical protein